MRFQGAAHFRHHGRFYVSAAIGVAVWLVAVRLPGAVRAATAGDFFFLPYLILAWSFAQRLTPDDLRRRAAIDDEGIAVIVLITLAAIALSLGSLVLLLDDGATRGFHLALAIATVPLGWLTLHTIMAFHYAHLFYSETAMRGDGPRHAGGLEFPGGEQEPDALDFLYYSFVVGMTAQVSDVQATSQAMRKTTLVHGIASFFFNTVILAVAVNVALARN